MSLSHFLSNKNSTPLLPLLKYICNLKRPLPYIKRYLHYIISLPCHRIKSPDPGFANAQIKLNFSKYLLCFPKIYECADYKIIKIIRNLNYPNNNPFLNTLKPYEAPCAIKLFLRNDTLHLKFSSIVNPDIL